MEGAADARAMIYSYSIEVDRRLPRSVSNFLRRADTRGKMEKIARTTNGRRPQVGQELKYFAISLGNRISSQHDEGVESPTKAIPFSMGTRKNATGCRCLPSQSSAPGQPAIILNILSSPTYTPLARASLRGTAQASPTPHGRSARSFNSLSEREPIAKWLRSTRQLPLAVAPTKPDIPSKVPYRVCKTIDIESGHMLSKHPEKCRFPHGHTRKVEFVLEAQELDRKEMVCDFLVVKEIIGDYLSSLDHALCLNTADPAYDELRKRFGDRVIPFENEDPTTEVMARVIFQIFAKRLVDYSATTDSPYSLNPGVRLVSVKVWETASSWAEYLP
jgi:6-pyruvoyltetrahydropterin/6-carboxytetrahydropterin synthase